MENQTTLRLTTTRQMRCLLWVSRSWSYCLDLYFSNRWKDWEIVQIPL